MKLVASARYLILILILLALAACGSAGVVAVTPTSQPQPTQAPAVTPSPEIAPTAILPTETVPTEIPAANLVACHPYLCQIPGFWELGTDGASPVALPITPGYVYDAAEATGRLLYSSKNQDRGAGPGNVAVGDLWWLDIRSGQSRPFISDQVVVEAVWAPNGQSFAYVLATPVTYELHWVGASGEDKLLAKDVAFTFSFSPSGEQVAFTRETGYNLNVVSGLYIVDIASGQERRISTVNRAGSGSVADQPIWSLDGKQILLPASIEGSSDWAMVAADGSQDTPLKIAPDVTAALNNDMISFALWFPDGLHLVGSTLAGMGGGPNRLVVFGLNPAKDTVISATVLRDDNSFPVAWDQPGVSVWVSSPGGMLEVVPVE